MPARARQLGVVAPNGRPLKKTSPADGRIWPPSILSTVDLPAPLGPMKTWMSRSRMSRSTESTALKGPYDLDRPRVESTTASESALACDTGWARDPDYSQPRSVLLSSVARTLATC